jgi:hypothetical protein
MRVCFFSLLLGYSLLVAAQEDQFQFTSTSEPFTERNFFRLGNRVLTLARHGYEDNKPFVLVSLHNNEHTAIQTGLNYVQQNGGVFYELVNNQDRYVAFELMNQRYLFDPNRIFTYKGREENLKMFKSWDKRTHDQVLQFAQFILNEIPFRKTIVALHNNTDAAYDINAYKEGGEYERETRAVHTNPDMDKDDFFLTSDEGVYEKLKERNYNVVLQHNQKVKDDGSLSVYCAKVNRKYINIETEFGHTGVQEEMLDVLEKVLK